MHRYFIIFIAFFLAFAPNDARKANEAYENGNYASAAELYRQAIQSNPDDARLYFNLGNSLAQIGRVEEAQQAYEQFKSMTDNPREQSLADYNIGNLYSESQQLDAAADYYRQALMNNPDDDDARHNYELTLRQQQQQQQQQQQDQNQDQDDDQDSQDDQQQQQDQEQQQDQNQDQQQDQGGDTDDQQEMETPMSLEEAQSILDALEQRERDLLRDREKDAQEERSDNDRDW
jgi:Ca-activated chloride channel homolog